MASDAKRDTVGPELRGVLLALELTQGGDAVAVLHARLGDGVRPAWQALRQLDQAARTAKLAAWRAEAANPFSLGICHLHPSWAEAALADAPPAIAAAIRCDVSRDQSMPPQTARELARLAFQHLEPLWESDAGPLADRLSAMTPDELVVDLKHRGAGVVGRSLAGAPLPLRARAMASAGEPWAGEIAAGSGGAVSTEERAAAQAFVAAGAVFDGRTAEDRLLGVGLAATKAELEAEGSGSLLRLAGRLPAALGRAFVGW